MASKIFFITGNEQTANIGSLLENLLYFKKTNNDNVLFIDYKDSFFLASAKKEQGRVSCFEYYPAKEITRLNLEKLVKETKASELVKQELGFSSFFIYGDITAVPQSVLNKTDYLFFLLKNDHYSAGYLYNNLKYLKQKKLAWRGGIVSCGFQLIEEAASFYLKIKNETEKLLNDILKLDFWGFYFLDLAQYTFAQKKSAPLLKIFPESATKGLIDYINTKLNELEDFEHDDSLLLCLKKKSD